MGQSISFFEKVKKYVYVFSNNGGSLSPVGLLNVVACLRVVCIESYCEDMSSGLPLIRQKSGENMSFKVKDTGGVP